MTSLFSRNALCFRLPGATRQFDHCCLVHGMWKHFLELGMQVLQQSASQNLRAWYVFSGTYPSSAN